MDSGTPLIKIGDLLIRASILTPEEFEDAVRLSDRMRQPLGRILSMNGYCTEANLDDAMNIQERLGDKTLTLESAVKAIEMIVKQGVDVETAIRKLNPVAAKRQELSFQHKLGDILVVTGILTPKQLQEGINLALNTHLPLGLVLVDSGAISAHVLHTALTLLEFARDGVITKEQASHALRLARFKNLTAEEAISDEHPDFAVQEQEPGLKELFVIAKVITENQLLAAREIDLVDGFPLSKTFVNLGWCSALCMDASMHMLSMVAEGALPFAHAVSILRRLRLAKSDEEMEEILGTIDEIVEEEEEVSVEVSRLLIDAGLVGRQEIESAKPLALQSKKSLMRVLVESGFLDEQMVSTVGVVKDLLEQGVLVMEQAKMLIVYCFENGASLDDAMRLFGWWRTISMPENY